MSSGSGYSARDLSRLTGLEPRMAWRLARDLDPSLGDNLAALDPDNRFDSETVLLLREAKKLLDAKVSNRRISAAMRGLRDRVQGGRPASELSLSVLNKRVVARSGELCWQPENGQTVLSFGEEIPAQEALSFGVLAGFSNASAIVAASSAKEEDLALPPPLVFPVGGMGRSLRDPSCAAESAEGWLESARELEEDDPASAEAAYRKALFETLPETLLGTDPALEELRFSIFLDLGRLVHQSGRFRDAIVHYESAAALARVCEQPELEALACFNLGVVQEDLMDGPAALSSYERAVGLDQSLADAWFNLSLLYEELGRKSSAIRCLKQYRELPQNGAEDDSQGGGSSGQEGP